MSGDKIVATLVESHTAVLRTRGIELAPDVIEEMARNAAGSLHAELQAELQAEAEDPTLDPSARWTRTWNKERPSP